MTVADEATETDGAAEPEEEPTAGNATRGTDGDFDWRGWLLVGLVSVCFLVVPAVVLLRPVRVVGFRTTFLLLPLVPAFLLGATAVWVAVRSRQRGR